MNKYWRKPVRLFPIFLLGICLCAVLSVAQGQVTDVPPTARNALLRDLQQRLSALRSTHLTYQVHKKGQDAVLEFFHSQKHRYWLITTNINTGRKSRLFAYVDLEKGRLIQPDAKQPREATIMDLGNMLQLTNENNPWSVYAAALQEKTATVLAAPGTGKLAPKMVLDFSIQGEELALALGLQQATDDRSVDVSWLRSELFTNAEQVTRDDNEVVLVLPDAHRVRIETQTGLLLEDSWQSEIPENMRGIVRVKDEAITRDVAASAHYPDLPKLKLKDALLDSLIEPYFRLFMTGLIAGNVDDASIVSVFDEYRKPFVEHVAVTAVRYWSKAYPQELNAEGSRKELLASMQQQLERQYRNYVFEQSDAFITLQQFVAMESLHEALMEQFLPPGMENAITMPETLDLQKFPVAVQNVLRRSYQDAFVGYTTGNIAALVAAVLDRVAKSSSIRNPLAQSQAAPH